jgi:DNA-damage-inducible protein J
MANVQVRVDDGLKEQAQFVAAQMGLDLSSAIRLFLAQMVQENRIPFQPTADPFYSVQNQEALRRSLAELDAGKVVTKSLDELRRME